MISPRSEQTLIVSLFFLVFFVCVRSSSAQDQDWEKKAEAKANELERKNGEGTDPALRSELLKMRDIDQDVRHRVIDAPEDKKKALETEEIPAAAHG